MKKSQKKKVNRYEKRTGGITAAVILTAVCVLSFSLVLCRMFIKGENIAGEAAENRLWMLLSAFGWLLVMLTLLLGAAWIFLSFLKAFIAVVCTLADENGKPDIRNPYFLKIVSLFLFILLAGFVWLPEERRESWFSAMQNIRGLAAPLTIFVILMAGYAGVHIIYKLLESFLDRESSLKKYLDKVGRLLADMIGQLLLCLIHFARFIPEFMQWGYDLLRSEEWDETPEEEEGRA